MKHKGSVAEFGRQRNRELLSNFKSVIGSQVSIDLDAAFREVVSMPASRFWVSEPRASIVVNDMMRGVSISGMNPEKRDMFREIFRRVELIRRDEKVSVSEAVFRVVNSEAPRFYLTPGTARVIIYRLRKMQREGGEL